MIKVIDNKIYLDWYHKKTFSGRLLSFFSNHPTCHKVGTIYSLVDRAILLSHPQFHKKNIEKAINILLSNGYPLDLIFIEIKRRLKHLSTKKFNKSNTNNTIDINTTNTNIKYFVIPYIESISDKVASAIKRPDTLVGYRCIKKLNNFIKVQKDRNDCPKNSNVIYKLNCNDCDATYVGQTKRQLGTRLKEHKNNIKLDSAKHSVVTEHILNEQHTFDWDNTKIMDHEKNYHKRLISEMIHIKEQKNGLNLNKDTELLDSSYFDILKELAES
jgi:hypothetical protein